MKNSTITMGNLDEQHLQDINDDGPAFGRSKYIKGLSDHDVEKQKRAFHRRNTPRACPICEQASSRSTVMPSTNDTTNDIRELVVVGAGPHSLSLILRLLEPDADLMSDKERHLQADFRHRMRPLSQVRRHIKELFKGPPATLKAPSRKSGKKRSATTIDDLPPLLLDFVLKNVTVVDANGSKGWMAGWNQNFETLDIRHLRSPIGAHCDPYDHRALEFYAEHQKRNDELVGLDFMERKTGRWDFHGPYNIPSTALFRDFHKQLAVGYGIENIVRQGRVSSIKVLAPGVRGGMLRCNNDEPIFELSIDNGMDLPSTIYTRRVVSAMGPAPRMFDETFSWEESLKKQVGDFNFSNLVLHTNEIAPWIFSANKTHAQATCARPKRRILIVGGGITSAHLALLAACPVKSPWCKSVMFIKRSKIFQRQFDIDEDWMGPARGKLQEDFASLSYQNRAKYIKEERRGGSISPEVMTKLLEKMVIEVKEEVEVSSVEWNDGEIEVFFDDGSEIVVDMIWLSTGFENHLCNYPALTEITRELPIEQVNGLPTLNHDLSWGKQPSIKREDDTDNDDDDEPNWKVIARKRLWFLGALAGLELGPDALNLMGGRQGSVRVAKAIRKDINSVKSGNDTERRGLAGCTGIALCA